MNFLISGGIIATILYAVYKMLKRARVDAVVSSLKRKDRTEEAKEIALLEKEIEDAKIRYDNARRDLNKFTDSGTGAD